ncbi:UbiA prenyltransferase family-domain-containing protein [Gautieria morchelliformis]|nr:UbiA prenyltransferase family-domain-containing protein [Gautieria morchelliformis]
MFKPYHPLLNTLSSRPTITNGYRHLHKVATSLVTEIAWHIHTLILFTYTDYKTIFCPITLFAAVAAPVYSVPRMLHSILWIWVHLLQCNVSNQYKSYDEDMINRPWRPIPSGRVSGNAAIRLRLCLVPICLGVSSFHGWDVVFASAGLTMTMILYDELQLAGHWVGKNFCNVSGYLTFELGATKVMGQTTQLDTTAWRAMAFSACVIFTTIQAQDFSDVEGDIKLGRTTFPIYAPSFSRLFTLFSMIAWSVILGKYWVLGPITLISFCCLGTFVGWRYYNLRASHQDSLSYLIFNIWLLFAHFLPAHVRWNILAV